jgi:invasion protein IalB
MDGLTMVFSSKFRGLAILAFGILLGALATAQTAKAETEAPRITSQAFGNWTYRCQQPMTDGKPGPAACDLTQNVIVSQGGKTEPVMSVSVRLPPKGKYYDLTFQLPLGVRIRQGVSVSVDEGTPQPLSYDFCGPGGCWADGAVSDTLLRAMKRGKTGRAKVVMFNGQPIVIEFTLAGLPEGLAALDSGAKKAP